MKKEIGLSKLKSKKNPYVKQLKKQVTMRIGTDVIEYFKNLAKETGMPYQNLINLYLRDCIATNKKPILHWENS
jgi:uncharacterized protein (DUF4415 family)